MLRSIVRSQAMADRDGPRETVPSEKVQVRRVRSQETSKTGEAGPDADGEPEVVIPAEIMSGTEQDFEAEVEPVEDDPSFEASADEDLDPDIDPDLEELEASGPGQFLIRRNAELLTAIHALRSEVEAVRRVVDTGNDGAADRIVRAIHRAADTTSGQMRQVSRLLVLVALLNLVLIGLAVHMFWPFPFLPAAPH